jgi:hypothetical protein
VEVRRQRAESSRAQWLAVAIGMTVGAALFAAGMVALLTPHTSEQQCEGLRLTAAGLTNLIIS